MITIPTNPKKRKHKHIKRKDRFRPLVDLGTPQVPLNNKRQQKQHELLSDWEDAP